ncbi:coat F domain protein [Peptococcaceae bacterium CEB3]|nr:coat F domain protein [Peptococcaceae bacterium CEB3]
MPNTPMMDKDYALDMLKDSKLALHSLTMALAESTNPLLRETLTNVLNASVDRHFRLADIAVNKGWYAQPNLAPLDLLKQDMTESQSLTS